MHLILSLVKMACNEVKFEICWNEILEFTFEKLS